MLVVTYVSVDSAIIVIVTRDKIQHNPSSLIHTARRKAVNRLCNYKKLSEISGRVLTGRLITDMKFGPFGLK